MTATPVNRNGFTLFRLILPCLMLAGLASGLTACSQGRDGSAAAPAPAHITIGGHAMGGQQPVTGSTVRIYQVTTNAGGSVTGTTQLGATSTNSSGAWSLTITCSSNNPVYAAALGGNPGAGNNPQIGLTAVLGACNTAAGLTNVNINEVTTVAMVFAFSQYLDPATATLVRNIDDNGNPVSLGEVNNAVTYAQLLADVSTGLEAGGLPVAAILKENTLADLIAACVNSTGGNAGDNSACGQTFSAAQASNDAAPTTTLQALLDIALAPGHNVTTLYQLTPPARVFAPTLSTAPYDWTLPPAGLISALASASIDGQLAYEASSCADGTSAYCIYLYNFKTGINTCLNCLWKPAGGTPPVSNSLNPSISPDGKWLVFTAIPNGVDSYHLFLWKIGGAASLVDLTASAGTNTKDQDPKWAADGTQIIYKRITSDPGDIALMNLDMGSNPPRVTSTSLLTTGGTQYSAPYLMPDQVDVVVFAGTGADETLATFQININAGTTTSGVTALGDSTQGLQEFYPIPWPGGDGNRILFARWAGTGADEQYNEICSLNIKSTAPDNGESSPCLFVTPGSDNDDPFPADQNQRFVFFASRRSGAVLNSGNTQSSDLYLGDATTGEAWSLTSLGVNSPADELGAAYSSAN